MVENIEYCVWPDSTICTLEELPEMTYMSDDYEVVNASSETEALLLSNQVSESIKNIIRYSN